MRNVLVACGLFLVLVGCEKYTHDENSAAAQAMEFAEIAFVQHDFEKGYLLMADKARAYVPLEKFKETVTSMHASGYPVNVSVIGAEAVNGEKIVNVALRGDGQRGSRFNYTLTLTGTAESGYRVTTFNGGLFGSLPSG